MYISNILYFDVSDNEADIIVSDGNYQMLCYAFPARSLKIGQCVKEIYCFACSSTIKAKDCLYDIVKLPDFYAYFLTGRILSKSHHTVIIGNITMHLDIPFHNDMRNGDYVSFRVQRLDAQL